MVKYFFTGCICLLIQINAQAQFSILYPGHSISKINDIEDGGNDRMIFAADNGIFIYDKGNWKIFSKTNGLSDNNVITIEPYASGFLYSTENTHIGSCDYVSIVNDRDFSSSSYPFGYITAIHVRTGEVLFGTNIGSVFRTTDVNQANPQTPVSQQFGGPTLGYVTAINQLQGSINYHVIASRNKIVIYDSPTGTAVQIETPQIPSNNVLCNITSGTTTYDGTDKGVYIFDFQNSSYLYNMSNSPIPSNIINAIAVSGSNLFLGTPAGLCVKVNNKWETFTSANSNLPSTDIVQLAVEKSTNSLWLATKEGHICRIGIHQLPTSIQNVKTDKPAIYPNPANDVLHLSGITPGSTYSVKDISGRTILHGIASNKVDISSLSRGYYMVELKSKDKAVNSPVVIY